MGTARTPGYSSTMGILVPWGWRDVTSDVGTYYGHASTLPGPDSYTGDTRITTGGLTLSGADRLSSQTALSVANGATFTLGNVNQRVGSLAGAGSVVLGSGTLSTGTNQLSSQFSGVISGTGGMMTLSSDSSSIALTAP